MRTFRTSLVMLLVLCSSFGLYGMSVEQSRNEAWFLTDKMAHELWLSNYQWDDVYEVNYDFFRSLGHVTTSYTTAERVREQKLMYILTVSQWNEYCRLSYFTHPVVAVNGNWSFTIYRHYAHDKFFDRNHNVVFTYKGNRSGWENYYRGRHVTEGSNHNYKNNSGSGYYSNRTSGVSRPSTRTPNTSGSRVTSSSSSSHVTSSSNSRVTTSTNSNSRRH